MPQFDTSKFSSQIFWFAICFAILYFFVSKIILPRIQTILEERKKAIDSDVASSQKLDQDIEKISAKTNALRQKANQQYQLKLEEANKESSAKREKLTEEMKEKIEKITNKSQEDIKKFIESTKSQSQSAINDLVKTIKSKLFNVS